MMKYKLLHILFSLFISCSTMALEIKGTIDLQEDWQPVVYLASLNSPDNLFVASPDFIIAETLIQPNGDFAFNITSIPKDARFYRLYLVKGNNLSVEFNTSEHRNFIHLLLEQNSSIKIDAKVEDNTLLVERLSGSPDNTTILKFDKEIAKKKQQFTADITKTKSEYLKKDLVDFIRNFVENEKNTLIGLYALYHLEEKDIDFLRNSEFYFDFQKRIKVQHPEGFYTQVYSELLEELVGYRDLVCEMPGVQPKWKDNLLLAQSILILVLILLIIILLVKSKRSLNQLKVENDKSQNLFSNLTTKEQEILSLLAAGKTNKEIALELYVELSTVKTHINSIYKQLHLASRKEAVEYYKALYL